MASDKRFASKRIVGARPYQEDSYGALIGSNIQDKSILVLSDGMGGQVAGAEASEVSVEIFISSFENSNLPPAKRLLVALHAANDELANRVEANPSLDGMGCTLVGVLVTAEGVQWVSVGDSPFWLYREGQLLRLNDDHSMAPVLRDLVDAGRMTDEEARTDPKRNALRSAVMGEEMELIDVHDQLVSLHPSDRLILASDGIETLSVAEIEDIIERNLHLGNDAIVDALISSVVAKDKPRQDNTTALVFEPFPVEAKKAYPVEEKKSKSGLIAFGVLSLITIVCLLVLFIFQEDAKETISEEAPIASDTSAQTTIQPPEKTSVPPIVPSVEVPVVIIDKKDAK